MVHLYTGTPGSGKSLHTAREIRDNLVYGGRLVVTNIDIAVDKIKGKRKRSDYIYMNNDEITPRRLVEISQERFGDKRPKEGEIKLYLDEAQLLFNARDWSKAGRSDWTAFFTQHRKLGYDIFLITQFDRMIDRQIRSLVEYEYVHRRVSNFGWRGKLVSAWCFGKLYMYNKRYYPLNEGIGSTYYVCKKKDWKLYDTFRTWE